MTRTIRCIRCGNEIMEGQDHWYSRGGPKHRTRDGCRRAREDSHRLTPDRYEGVDENQQAG